jgi:hypothetical protein
LGINFFLKVIVRPFLKKEINLFLFTLKAPAICFFDWVTKIEIGRLWQAEIRGQSDRMSL